MLLLLAIIFRYASGFLVASVLAVVLLNKYIARRSTNNPLGKRSTFWLIMAIISCLLLNTVYLVWAVNSDSKRISSKETASMTTKENIKNSNFDVYDVGMGFSNPLYTGHKSYIVNTGSAVYINIAMINGASVFADIEESSKDAPLSTTIVGRLGRTELCPNVDDCRDVASSSLGQVKMIVDTKVSSTSTMYVVYKGTTRLLFTIENSVTDHESVLNSLVPRAITDMKFDTD